MVIDDFVGFAIRCLSVDMKTGKSNKIIPSSSTLGKTKVLRKYNFDAFGSLISTNKYYKNNIFDFGLVFDLAAILKEKKFFSIFL